MPGAKTKGVSKRSALALNRTNSAECAERERERELAEMPFTPMYSTLLDIFNSSLLVAGFSTPWEALDNSTEQYFLKWEGKCVAAFF